MDKRKFDLIALKVQRKYIVLSAYRQKVFLQDRIDCLRSDEFNEHIKCQWKKNIFFLFKPKNSTETAVLRQENDDNEDQVTLNSENSSDQIETTVSDVNEGDYVVLTYEMKGYIVTFISVDESDNEVDVTCMEARDKMEGRCKWPRKKNRIWIPKNKHFKKPLENPAECSVWILILYHLRMHLCEQIICLCNHFLII